MNQNDVTGADGGVHSLAESDLLDGNAVMKVLPGVGNALVDHYRYHGGLLPHIITVTYSDEKGFYATVTGETQLDNVAIAEILSNVSRKLVEAECQTPSP